MLKISWANQHEAIHLTDQFLIFFVRITFIFILHLKYSQSITYGGLDPFHVFQLIDFFFHRINNKFFHIFWTCSGIDHDNRILRRFDFRIFASRHGE